MKEIKEQIVAFRYTLGKPGVSIPAFNDPLHPIKMLLDISGDFTHPAFQVGRKEYIIKIH